MPPWFKTIGVRFSTRFKQGYALLYWLMILVLFVMEVWVVKDSINGINQSYVSADSAVGAGVRVNFGNYDKALKRVQDSQNFTPSGEPAVSPFQSDSKTTP